MSFVFVLGRYGECIMAMQWIWLSGFATNLGFWEEELMEVNSNAKHTFVSYTKVIANPNDLYSSIPGLAKADVVVACDLAAQALVLSTKARPQGQKWMFLAPMINFCEGEEGWPKSQAVLMAKAMVKNTKAALQSYMEMMGPCDESIQEDWMDQALKMPPSSLAKGLEYLAQATVLEEPIHLENTEMFFGREDQLVTPTYANKVKSLLLGTTSQERIKSGHWAHTLLF